MDNEYRAAIKEFRLSWLEREYGELFSAKHISENCAPTSPSPSTSPSGRGICRGVLRELIVANFQPGNTR